MDGLVLSGTNDVFVLGFPIIICKEMLINDSINIGVTWGFDGGSSEVRFISLSINREGAEEFLGLVKGFFDGEGSFNPVDHGIDFFQPGES